MALDIDFGKTMLQLITSRYDDRHWRKKIEKTLSLEEAMSRLTKAGINLGYQSFIIFYPATGQGLVVMTNSEHGEILCKALIRRAATLYGWPRVADLIE